MLPADNCTHRSVGVLIMVGVIIVAVIYTDNTESVYIGVVITDG